MVIPSYLAAVPLRTDALRWTSVRFYLLVAAFAAGNLLVPLALHSIPNAGAMFLPLFFFTLIAAWQFGFGAGIVVALVSPVLNTFVVGMPVVTVLPVVLAKSLALAVAASMLSRTTKRISLAGVLAAVAAFQVVGFVAERFAGLPVMRSLDLLLLSIPGMVLLVGGGYAVLRQTNRWFAEGQ